MKQTAPRIVLAGTNSGCGKTTTDCAILQALVNRGLRAGAFKCGPDYIDPMFHREIIGARSSNLDSFFFSDNTLRYLLARNAAGCDISVIEGVMGYYDGLGLDSMRASTCEIAGITQSPVILVVNARGASLSVLAVLQGFLEFAAAPEGAGGLIRGVILNQCSEMSYAVLSDAIRKHFAGRIEPLGYMPVMKECSLESRHLGLVTAEEVDHLKAKLQLLAEQAERTIQLDAILRLAEQAPPIRCDQVRQDVLPEQIRIAVARDRAFCFYYDDSLQMLRDMGAELVPFSPLHDSRLPERIDGLYLGGGYPELYAGELSGNASMLDSVRSAVLGGLPCIAECGGFMYLTDRIDAYPMTGVISGHSYDTGRLSRFGYITLTALRDNMLCRAGEQIAAHEFHHWDSDDTGAIFRASKVSGRTWDCVHASDHLYAGYPHFHFYSNPSFAQRFAQACLRFRHAGCTRVPDETDNG